MAELLNLDLIISTKLVDRSVHFSNHTNLDLIISTKLVDYLHCLNFISI